MSQFYRKIGSIWFHARFIFDLEISISNRWLESMWREKKMICRKSALIMCVYFDFSHDETSDARCVWQHHVTFLLISTWMNRKNFFSLLPDFFHRSQTLFMMWIFITFDFHLRKCNFLSIISMIWSEYGQLESFGSRKRNFCSLQQMNQSKIKSE